MAARASLAQGLEHEMKPGALAIMSSLLPRSGSAMLSFWSVWPCLSLISCTVSPIEPVAS